jgi:regulation of enolase protein 1 (concanavalin A-like superfamily)
MFFPLPADVLRALETTVEDQAAFATAVHRLRQVNPDAYDERFVQWYLEAAEPCSMLGEAAISLLADNWTWHDPFGDSSLVDRNGLEISTANGRDLWRANFSAPRLLVTVNGDFAFQTSCEPASPDKPAMGGILLWKDRQNLLRLDRGTRGEGEIFLFGCLDNENVFIGRGRLAHEAVVLRLERSGSMVRGLCSANGADWYTVGQIDFPVDDPVEVGLYAAGMIDRILYPGAFTEGTAIRFTECTLAVDPTHGGPQTGKLAPTL